MGSDTDQPEPPVMQTGFAIRFLKAFLGVVLGIVLSAPIATAIPIPNRDSPQRTG